MHQSGEQIQIFSNKLGPAFPKPSERGSALMAVLVIITVLTATLGTMASIWLAQRRLVQQKAEFLQARYNAESALWITLDKWASRKRQAAMMRPLLESLPLPEGDSARVKSFPWGAFQWLTSIARKGTQVYRLQRLCSTQLRRELEPAILLSPQHGALVVCGGTRIRGKVTVSASGVTSAVMDGRPYSGEKLIYGEIVASARDHRPAARFQRLGSLFENWHALLKKELHPRFPENDPGKVLDLAPRAIMSGVPVFETSEHRLNQQRGLLKGPAILIIRGPLTIEHQLELAAIQVVASGPIFIGGSLRCRNVIFMTPEEIEVKGLSDASIQLFAGRGIAISNSELVYPSVAVAYGESDSLYLDLHTGSRLAGAAFCISQKTGPSPTKTGGLLRIGKNSTIRGLAFSNRRLCLKGLVEGTVITAQFYLYHSPHHFYKSNLEWKG